MRLIARAVALVLPFTFASCLQAVDLPAGPEADGSLSSGRDASTSLPDASVACTGAGQCPPPVQTDPVCAPVEAACLSGECSTRRLPLPWDSHPGACRTAADCDCQNLPHEQCLGTFQCSSGRCEWTCGGCQSDLECPIGAVCQELSCDQAKACVAGCRDTTGCASMMVCDHFVHPRCGERYGQCEPASACQRDEECPIGNACDFTGVGEAKACIPGCHTADQCPAGQGCSNRGGCPDCLNCPCVGQCESHEPCQADRDCPTGTVCGTEWDDCNRHCVPGCHEDSQCRPDQKCGMPLPCSSCGCDHQHCEPRPAACDQDSDCSAGQICAYDDHFQCSGSKSCQPGCLEEADCAANESCLRTFCGACCPGVCTGLSCPMWQQPCSDSTDCSWNSSYCENGCCVPCPTYDALPCADPNQCLYGGGVGMDGCAMPPHCESCCACATDEQEPFCGVNYQSYWSLCEIQCAGVEVLHSGACLPFEGMGCNFTPVVCPAGQYCRDSCPMCDAMLMRCTLAGACLYDSDCPAGIVGSCPGATFTCEADHRCLAHCP